MIRTSIYDIVKSNEVAKFVEEDNFEHLYDVISVYENATKFLSHRYNNKCLVYNPDGLFRCYKIDNLRASTDDTKHMFIPLPNNYSIPCLKILEEIGPTSELSIDENGNVINFKSPIPFFHPVRHVPPTKPTNDLNISHVEGYIFQLQKTMQNM